MLKNHFCVVLFGGIQLKRAFYSRFFAHAFDLVIFDCSKSLPTNDPGHDGLVIHCDTHLLLLRELQAIPQDRNLKVNCRYMNTLVIENISAFYWALKCLKLADRTSWYHQLNRIVQTIKVKYKCNVIVTGWDNDYERGFNIKSSRPGQPQNLDDLTFIPKEFYRGAERVFTYQTGRSFVFEGNQWHKVKPEQYDSKRRRVEMAPETDVTGV